MALSEKNKKGVVVLMHLQELLDEGYIQGLDGVLTPRGIALADQLTASGVRVSLPEVDWVVREYFEKFRLKGDVEKVIDLVVWQMLYLITE